MTHHLPAGSPGGHGGEFGFEGGGKNGPGKAGNAGDMDATGKQMTDADADSVYNLLDSQTIEMSRAGDGHGTLDELYFSRFSPQGQAVKDSGADLNSGSDPYSGWNEPHPVVRFTSNESGDIVGRIGVASDDDATDWTPVHGSSDISVKNPERAARFVERALSDGDEIMRRYQRGLAGADTATEAVSLLASDSHVRQADIELDYGSGVAVRLDVDDRDVENGLFREENDGWPDMDGADDATRKAVTDPIGVELAHSSGVAWRVTVLGDSEGQRMAVSMAQPCDGPDVVEDDDWSRVETPVGWRRLSVHAGYVTGRIG